MRFLEFEGEWEIVRLKNIVQKVSEKNKENKIDIVFSNSATKGIVLQTEYFDKNIANKDNLCGYYIVASNDFVYNPRISSNAEVGAMSVNHTELTGLVSPLYTVFRIINVDIDTLFLEYIFKSKVWHNYMRSIASYGARNDRMNVKDVAFFDLLLCMPLIREQRKIASLLFLIDQRISTQIKIIERYESLIKGIYTYLLGEADKYRKLGEFCEIKKGEQINKTELLETGEYYVMNGGVTPSGFYHSYNAEANTISISEGGNSCGYIQYNDVPFWSGGHCYTLVDIEKDIDNRYLFYYLKANEPQIMELRIGSGLPNIQKKDLIHFCVPLPPLLNQKEIADALDKIITKIELEKFAMSTYQKQKKFLLQNLFI